MHLDRDLLRSIRHRWRFKERIGSLPLYIFEDQTRFLVKQISLYYKQFKDCQVIDKESFMTWLAVTQGGKIDHDDLALINRLLADFDRDLTPEAEAFLTERIHDSDAAYRAAEAVEKFMAGDEIDIGPALRNIVDNHGRNLKLDEGISEITDDVGDILEATSHDSGLQWFLPTMSKVMRPAQPGDQILVAARPDSGKTSFLANLAAHWSRQLADMGDDRPIVWLNNEGPGSRIKLRLYQTVLAATLEELGEYATAGTLEECYRKTIKSDRIRIFDVHGRNTVDLERLFERTSPAVIVYDMLDHVRYTGVDLSRNTRTDEYLEGLYLWAREKAVQHNAVSCISTQLSGDAENMQYPSLGMLKDSKTGKQGQADAIITVGMTQTNPLTRYIGLTKNKLNLGRKGSTARIGEVIFDGARGQYSLPEAQ